MLGDVSERQAFAGLIGLLKDASPRVRFFAAIALGKLGRPEAAEPLLEMVRASGDQDPYLRHAGVMGLTGSGKTAAWGKAIHDESPAARMAVLLAMRRAEDPEIARFLEDPDARVVLEAARAINDVPIAAAFPALAAVAASSSGPLPLLRRVFNANSRLGGPEHAAVLAAAAERADLPETARGAGSGAAGEVGEAAGPRPGGGPLAADRSAVGRARRSITAREACRNLERGPGKGAYCGRTSCG